MTEDLNTKEFLDTLLESEKLYKNICDEVLKLSEKTGYEKELRNFAGFIIFFTNNLVDKGKLDYLINLDTELIEKLSPRIKIHRFTQFDLDTNNDRYFEYYNRIDEEHEELPAIKNLTEYKQHVKRLQNLMKENPPDLEKQRSKKVNNYQLEKYFMDILDSLVQHYESFSLVSLYCLILVKEYLELSTKDDFKKLQNSKKDTVSKLYFDVEGLKKLIKKVKFQEPFNSEIETWYETIYGKESIREIRNLKTHYFSENEKMKYEKGLLHVTFQSGSTKTYTFEEIKRIKTNMQLAVFLCYYMVNNSYYYMQHQILSKEL